jgi:hypothetical protein
MDETKKEKKKSHVLVLGRECCFVLLCAFNLRFLEKNWD